MSSGEDPTQGARIGSTPSEDATSGGAPDTSEDPTQGAQAGGRPDEDPTQGEEEGEQAAEDPTQGAAGPGVDPTAPS